MYEEIYFWIKRICTVGENIIATIKIRNNFGYPLKMVNFSNIAIAKLNFFIAPHLDNALTTLQ